MNIKPEYRERLVQALIAFITVVVSITGSMIVDNLVDVTEPVPPVSPIEEPILALGTTHFTNLAVTEDITFGGILYPGFTDLTVSTAGQSLTPEYMVYALDSGGAISMTLTACTNEGQLLILIGDDANNVTINDSNLRSHDGNALVLGQYDVAMLVCQDTEWIQLVELANQ